MNTMTFATREAYLDAKDNGGAIYNIFQESTSTSPISITVVSYITATGETLIDAMNVFVEPELGDIGDTLYYITTTNYTGFKWLKSKAGYSATSYGQTFYSSAVIPNTTYKEVGVLINRNGKNGLIMRNTESNVKWLPEAYQGADNDIPGTTYKGSNTNKLGDGTVTTYCSLSRAFAEESHGSNYYQYSWPFPKSAWDAMMLRVWANADGTNTGNSMTVVASVTQSSRPKVSGWFESSGGTFVLTEDTTPVSGKTYYTGYIWTVTPNTENTTGGVGTASFTYTGPIGGMTINPVDYHYDFDEWYKKNVLVQWPTTAACAGDFDGRQDTKSITKWAKWKQIAAADCAAYFCDELVVANVPDYGQGKWWLPSVGELLNACRNHAVLKKKGVAMLSTGYNIWSSTQFSSTGSWRAYLNGSLNTNSRQYAGRVCAVSAFQF